MNYMELIWTDLDYRIADSLIWVNICSEPSSWPGPKPGRAVRGFSQRIGDGARVLNLIAQDMSGQVTQDMFLLSLIHLCVHMFFEQAMLKHHIDSMKAFHINPVTSYIDGLPFLSFHGRWAMRAQRMSCWNSLHVTVMTLGENFNQSFDSINWINLYWHWL